MNKKEDSMKRLSGEITDLKAGLLKNSFVLFFIIFNSLSFGQIPINGFCSNTIFPVPKDYSRILSADLNSNGSDEFIFYSPENKIVGIYFGIPGEKALIKEYRISSEISQIKRIKEKSGSPNLFVAVDRKHRQILLMSVYIDSVKNVSKLIDFDSYPEKILTGDVDLDGNEEILVSGSGFDGLSIIFPSKIGTGENKIITGTSFSEAVFIDFSDDGYPDIIAFNILENSLQFFVNNTKGIFRQTRSIKYADKISNLKTADFNNDGLNDLIYSSGKSMEIIYGDYQVMFSNKKSLTLDDKVSGIVLGDFNGDKYLDIAFTLVKGTLNIHFAMNDSTFYESVTYLNNIPSGIFAKFGSGGKDNIVAFIQSGEISVITTVREISKDLKIVPAIQAGTIKKFDYGKDNILDICFIDEYDNYLKVFLSNKSGVPSLFYYLPVAEKHKEVLVGDFFSEFKTFYCYSEHTPLLEVFTYNFKMNNVDRKQLYAPGEILDLNLQRVDSSLVNIFVAYNKRSKLYLGKFENRDLSITFKEFPVVDRNVTSAKIRLGDEPEIFYWKNDRDTLYFNKADVKPGPNNLKSYFKIPDSEALNINLYGSNIYSNDYPTIVSFVQNDEVNYMLLFSGERFSKSSQFFSEKVETNTQFGSGFFGQIETKGINYFTVYNLDDNYIYTLKYSEREKNYLLNRTIAIDNAVDYLFAKLNQKLLFVYSNTKGELSISLVKK
jgi:hypothetical protein